ncbi:MAG TPA: CBS domain-containing protein, partial [Anaerolineae bacterium]|nr:CBS domain-containing protein [Anaerolineae bacterium]
TMTQRLVRDWMTPNPIPVAVTDSVREAYYIVKDHVLRRLPVVNDEGQVVGMITMSDVRKMVEDQTSSAGM